MKKLVLAVVAFVTLAVVAVSSCGTCVGEYENGMCTDYPARDGGADARGN